MARGSWAGITAFVIGTVGIVGVVAAQETSPASASPTIPTLNDVKPKLLHLVIDDQWDRGNDMFGGRQVKAPDTLDWEAIARRDQERESAARSLLADGQIETGKEFQFAALIFQYLQRQKQPQLFGTQFTQQDGEWTMAPYDRDAVPDGVRALWCVVPQASQDEALKAMRAGKAGGANTSIADCK